MPLSTQGLPASSSMSTMSDPRTCAPLPQAIPVYNVDGTLNDAGYITKVVNLMVQYRDHSERATFHVMGIGRMTIILGHMWLVKHNPKIDWSTRKVSMTRCPAACVPNDTVDDINRPKFGSAD